MRIYHCTKVPAGIHYKTSYKYPSNYVSNDALYKELLGKVPELYLVGDAKSVQVQYIANIHGPYRLALTI